MKKIYRVLGTFAFLFASVGANAQTIWADDFTVGAGQNATVKIHVKNVPEGSDALDLSFDLPEDVFIVGHEGEDAVEFDAADFVWNTNAVSSKTTTIFTFDASYVGEGAYNMTVMCTEDLFKGNALTDAGDWFVAIEVATNATSTKTGKLTFNKEYTNLGTTSANDFETPDAEAIVSDKFVVKLPSSGVATICSTVDLDMKDLDAYYVKEVVDKKVKGVKIDGALKALEGAVIQGEAGQVIEIPVATTEAAAPEKNLLVGVTKFTKFTDVTGIYFMSGGKFKKAAANGTLAAGKAYLDANASAKGFDELEFVVEDDVTAIKAVETEQNAGVLYNLNGIRVDNPTKGVYIQNGRKVVVK